MKIKILLPVLMLIAITTLLPAQQYWQPLYNTNGWLPESSGLSSIYMDHAGNIYVAGMQDNYNTLGEYNYSIWEWNGANWSRLADTSSINNFVPSSAITICGDLQNNIYSIYSDYNLNVPTYYVARWNGTSWSLLDNSPWATTGVLVAINNDQYGNIYAAVALDSVANGIGFEIYKLNGSSWSQLGTGLPALENSYNDYYNGIVRLCADKYGNVYVGGEVSSQPSSNLANIMVWNGSNWSAATYNNDLIYSSYGISSLCADTSGNVYATGYFALNNTYNNTSVMRWNGTQWAALNSSQQNNYLYDVEFACVDGAGNPYATSQGGVYSWDGSNWNSVGNISSFAANGCYGGYVNQMAANSNGTLYTAVSFQDVNDQNYLAQYNTLAPGQILAYTQTNGYFTCTQPGYITVTAYGGTPPYQYQWNDGESVDSITVNIDSIYTVTVTDAQSNQTTVQSRVCDDRVSTVNGVVFKDVNNDCIYDSSEALLPNVVVGLSFANGNFSNDQSSGYNGFSVWATDTGSFKISISDYSPNCTSFNVCFVNGDSTGYIPSICSTLGSYNIALTDYVANPDLTMHVGWTAANPGFGKQYWVLPYNLSNNPPPDSATIVFNYDPNLIYDSAQAPLPMVDLNAHTLTWVVSGYNIPYYTWNWLYERFNSFFTVPANLSPGYVLQSSFVIEPVSTDCDSTNNRIYIPQEVTGSHDPNAKDVYPSGGLSDADTVLTYTIYYQNTGTDSTHFIVVTDTLSSYLDPYSVINLASSNNYSSFTVSNSILTWTFNPLQLPDSTVDNARSKGFITFSVKRSDNLTLGTRIQNQAAIQFDYNANVYTNIITSTIGPTAITSLDNTVSVQAFPNPFSDVTHFTVTGINGKFGFGLYDVTGRLQLTTTPIATKFDVPRDQLASGVYLYGITQSGNIIARGKLVVE